MVTANYANVKEQNSCLLFAFWQLYALEKGIFREMTNKKIGLRLHECRKLRKLTQKELAERAHFTKEYIGLLERGEREIDWNKAHLFADLLQVSADYIMCASDIIENAPSKKDISYSDILFLMFLEYQGHTINMIVTPKKYNFKDLVYVPLENVSRFDFSSPFCRCKLGNEQKECEILYILLDGKLIMFKTFTFIIKNLYHSIDENISNAGNLQTALDEIYDKPTGKRKNLYIKVYSIIRSQSFENE